jgi:hypothetical protein
MYDSQTGTVSQFGTMGVAHVRSEVANQQYDEHLVTLKHSELVAFGKAVFYRGVWVHEAQRRVRHDESGGTRIRSTKRLEGLLDETIDRRLWQSALAFGLAAAFVTFSLTGTAHADDKTHDGFYLQAATGLGYYSVSGEPIPGQEQSISGMTIPMSLMLGAHPSMASRSAEASCSIMHLRRGSNSTGRNSRRTATCRNS